jgi:hypothetical protein
MLFGECGWWKVEFFVKEQEDYIARRYELLPEAAYHWRQVGSSPWLGASRWPPRWLT